MNIDSETRGGRAPTALMLFAVVVLTLNLRAPLTALGPVVGMIRQDLAVSAAFVGMVAALPMLAFSLCAPLAAFLSRRMQMTKILTAAAAVMAVGILLRSAYPNPWFLAGGTLVLSAAVAMGNVLLPALAKQNMPGRVGLLIGTMSATMSVSAAVSAAAAVPLARWGSWQWSLGIWALSAVSATLVWKIWGGAFRAQRPSEQVSDGLNMWRSRAAWCISLCMGIQSLMFYSIVNFLPSVLAEKGISPEAAGGYTSLLQAASLIGVLALSTLIGRSGRRQFWNLAGASVLAAGIAGIWLGSADSVWLWVVCIGIGGSGVFSALMILFALRTDTPAQAAALSGMAQSAGYLIAAFGPLGMGVMYDVFGSWTVPMGVLTALMAAECVLAWFAAAPQTVAQADRRI